MRPNWLWRGLSAAMMVAMAAGCGSTATSVRSVVATHAESDLACARSAVRITDLGEQRYTATGCGGARTYACEFGSAMLPPTCRAAHPIE